MTANSPSELYDLFSKYFSARAADLLLTLYEDNAVILSAPGQSAAGKQAIREALNGFLAINGEFLVHTPTVVQSGDIALLMAKWSLKGTGADGKPVEINGQTSDVARQQPDASWLFVIDNPFGAANI